MTSSWVPGADESGFGADNLPYGVFTRSGGGPRVGVRVGDHVLDLAAALGDPEFSAPSLNPFMARGSTAWRATRAKVSGMLTSEGGRASAEPHLVPLGEVDLRPPFEVADYVDFYCSLEHASNVGRIFRPDEEPLKPNWRHLPVGYHGRSGTVVPSGTDIVRPSGQRRSPDSDGPLFGPSTRLDIEAELGFVVGKGTSMGRPVPVSDFAEHVFGVVLVNDWSARDIQAWEYVPLGPFLGKSFATSVSPWVVPLDALGAARFAGREQTPEPLPHLHRVADWGLDLALEVRLNGEVVSRPPYAAMYWTADQMLAHLTSNGASLRTGDLYASGTVSGSRRDQRGSLLELSWGGAEPLTLADGSVRTFLEDGDAVAVSATARGMAGGTINLGEVTGTVRPACG
ncbi:fumarylacetoacetase [Spinactinospora alkalitolerans]|uniref:fumarylacetoacetase n=1 Tax=Spinactinospora alkalitolerans TaxID=687207 RepID=A0A852TQA3_9ACTN|nr:fumarylacetoacetase [Spinactinospora alkalitolerans]NYE46159.1 fumarylacetoacetase [Spinactinospora alkalitolerans]